MKLGLPLYSLLLIFCYKQQTSVCYQMSLIVVQNYEEFVLKVCSYFFSYISGSNKHQSAVTCLQFNKKFVITSSDDGTVKIWDLKTGDFLRNLVTLESGGSGGVVWRVRCSNTKLVCAVGSRNGTEETKLLVLDFDVEEKRDNKIPMIERV